MKSMKKLAFLFMVALCLRMMCGSALAATTTENGVEVLLITDKTEYSSGEDVITTLTVKNTNDFAVNNISLETIMPEGYQVAEGVKTRNSINTLAAGESVSLNVTYSQADNSNVEPPVKTGDTANDIIWICALIIFGGVAVILLQKKGKKSISMLMCVLLIGSNAAVMQEVAHAEETIKKTVTVTETVMVDAKEVTVSAVVSYEIEMEKVTLSCSQTEFAVSENGAEVCFYAKYSGTPKKITLMDKNTSAVVTDMADDGLESASGDKSKDDNVYSCKVKLDTAKEAEFAYYVEAVSEAGVVKSNIVTVAVKKQAPVVKVEELVIQNGDKDVYGKIYYPGTEGKHPAIIMCHGYNGSHADFLTECRYFANNGYIAYTLDFCGGSARSKSSGKTTETTIFTEKEDLLAVFDYISAMEAVDSEQVYLFGGSQGGLVAALAAEERAEQVKGLALYFPAFNIPDNWRQTFPNVDMIPETYEFWGLTLGKCFFADMHDFYTFDNIGKFAKDVLIVQGDKDYIAPLAASQTAARLYENAELVVLPGEGHGFTPAGAKTAMEKVLKFMQEH